LVDSTVGVASVARGLTLGKTGEVGAVGGTGWANAVPDQISTVPTKNNHRTPMEGSFHLLATAGFFQDFLKLARPYRR
jgi:hypothetical protein